jgi:two-component system cell cycle response regulator
MLIWGLSNVSLVLAYRIASGELRKDDPQLTIDTLLAALVMSVSLIGAMLLIGYVSEQMNYILASNTRQKQLIEECNMDALMGIANRRALNSKLSEIVEKSPEKPYPILLMLDIDNFKKVNDTFGHVCGDEVLMTLAGIIKSSINGRKINAYRFGGEEIVILFEEYDKEDAYKEADSIRKTFSNVKYPFDQKLCVTFSAGMAEYENGFSADRWVVKADERLYMAKNDGKNRIHA